MSMAKCQKMNQEEKPALKLVSAIKYPHEHWKFCQRKYQLKEVLPFPCCSAGAYRSSECQGHGRTQMRIKSPFFDQFSSARSLPSNALRDTRTGFVEYLNILIRNFISKLCILRHKTERENSPPLWSRRQHACLSRSGSG